MIQEMHSKREGYDLDEGLGSQPLPWKEDSECGYNAKFSLKHSKKISKIIKRMWRNNSFDII